MLFSMCINMTAIPIKLLQTKKHNIYYGYFLENTSVNSKTCKADEISETTERNN